MAIKKGVELRVTSQRQANQGAVGTGPMLTSLGYSKVVGLCNQRQGEFQQQDAEIGLQNPVALGQVGATLPFRNDGLVSGPQLWSGCGLVAPFFFSYLITYFKLIFLSNQINFHSYQFTLTPLS